MSEREQEDLLDTLLLPFAGQLPWNADACFLRARHGGALARFDVSGLACEQTFKPYADELTHAGFKVTTDIERRFPLVLALPPRQRDEARALLARALTLATPGGRVVVCQHNNEGGRTMESDLTKLAGEVTTLSKHRCRVCWTAPLDDMSKDSQVQEWLRLDAPRSILDGRFMSRPGLFAWDRVDIASQLLASSLPGDLRGAVADLGAGFGYLSVEALERSPRIGSLDLYEAEHRALALAQLNLSSFESRLPIRYHWHDVTQGLPHRYDAIVMNPPFHASHRSDRPDIGRQFIGVAAEALNRTGRLFLVANRHLPYESVLNDRFGTVRTLASEHGFKVIEATKAR